MAFEYRTVPAPRRGIRLRGARGEEARFAAAVEAEMNRLAAEGWEYLRSDTLPSEERQGWFAGRATVFRTLLVFRRARPEAEVAAPAFVHAPAPVAAPPAPPPAPLPEPPAPVAAPVAAPVPPAPPVAALPPRAEAGLRAVFAATPSDRFAKPRRRPASLRDDAQAAE